MTRTPLDLLLIEDSEMDAELVVIELRRYGYDVSVARVDNRAALVGALETRCCELVLCDHGLPSFSSLEALEIVRAESTELPFVILSGTIGEEAAVEALRAGARDVVLKTNLARLGPVVERELREAENRRRQHRAEEALHESEALKSAILASAPDCVITLDERGRIIDFNPAAEQTFGYRSGDVAGRPMVELIIASPLAERYRDAFARYLETGESELVGRRLELTGLRADGSEFPMELSIARGDLSGRPFFTAYLRDISERKRGEDERARLAQGLVQAQKMEAVGRLAGSVAHDFNNLLSVIIGFAELVQKPTGLSADRVSAYAEQIATAGKHGAALVKRMLAFSREQEFEPQAIDLTELIGDLEPMLRSLLGEAVELEVDVPPGVGLVLADPVQLEQVLLNLATNARDAMPTGGSVTVRAAASPPPARLTVREYVRLSVSDSGIGMDEATLARIFDPFFTTKPLGVGTGLGLSSAHAIIEQTGGRIDVESVPGAGTTFHVYLPEAVGASASSGGERPAGGPERAPREACVLVVEDDPALRALVELVLGEAGYRVIAAASPHEALRLANEHGDRIELLLTDVVMPGMSGTELAAELSARRPDLPILFMSGYEEKSVVAHAPRREPEDLVAKPFTPDELVGRVAAALASPVE